MLLRNALGASHNTMEVIPLLLTLNSTTIGLRNICPLYKCTLCIDYQVRTSRSFSKSAGGQQTAAI